MLNCAICDNDKIIVDTVMAMVKNAFKETGCIGNIETYTDSRCLLSDILEYRPFDLVITEIEMLYFNGKQVVAEIRRRFPQCCIIFLTSHIEYAVETCELGIFRYTLKNDIHIKLPEYLKEALMTFALQKENTYPILKCGNIERLPYNQILYIRKDGKYSVVNCVDKREIRIRKTLHVVAEELKDQTFIFIDRGCIVNIALINKISANEVICKNGERLPISRSKLKETKSRVMRYWGIDHISLHNI